MGRCCLDKTVKYTTIKMSVISHGSTKSVPGPVLSVLHVLSPKQGPVFSLFTDAASQTQGGKLPGELLGSEVVRGPGHVSLVPEWRPEPLDLWASCLPHLCVLTQGSRL